MKSDSTVFLNSFALFPLEENLGVPSLLMYNRYNYLHEQQNPRDFLFSRFISFQRTNQKDFTNLLIKKYSMN